MEGNDFIWIASIIVGITLLIWLVIDWLESTQNWESYENDGAAPLGRSEAAPRDALDVETELMMSYPLDPFAPALLWRPRPSDAWIEAQEQPVATVTTEPDLPPNPLRASEAS